jgi:DNA-binding response OmpR family regulator
MANNLCAIVLAGKAIDLDTQDTLLSASLQRIGITYTCTDGQEAWHWLQAHLHPTLVITDVEMPNMDGFTLVDRCRQAGITVPILVISSRLSEEWFDEAKRLGATDYLTKGFSTIDLIKKVRMLLKTGETGSKHRSSTNV